ncbi:MAG TPA: trehalase family glycosidase [Caulobacteraceae bacterium]
MRGVSKRQILQGGGLAVLEAAFGHAAFAQAVRDDWAVPVPLQHRMYRTAIDIARRKIRGGPRDPAFPKPFLDAAFSTNIFLWDTCFIAAYAKYHQAELPIANALDNFYVRQDADGFICREYTEAGLPVWPKDHPISINPPLFAFAELELYSQSKDLGRLAHAYPTLKRFFDFLHRTYRCDDGLYFSDAVGSGMDNIPRHPDGWRDDHAGLPIHPNFPKRFNYTGLNAAWNRQGRSVDFSAQMALFADNLRVMAGLLGESADMPALAQVHADIGAAVNQHCWNEADGFYYDLGYGEQIRRKHIGMFWVMLAGIVPPDRLDRMLAHLVDPAQFWRRIPVASWPADQAGFSPIGNYWKGSVWAPTNYMIIRGLERCGQHELATRLARQYYWSLAQVFKSTGTFWENYAPDAVARGNIARPDFCGWTGLAPIALYHEFIA